MYYVVNGEIRARGKFPKTRMEALRESIAKWKFAASLPRQFWRDGGTDGGTGTCALCHVYFRKGECKGCPVKKATGYSCCEETPYALLYHSHSDRPSDELKFLRGLERRLSRSRRRPARAAKKAP